MKCPLCASERCCREDADRRREFIRCSECDLVFVPEPFHLTPERERARYALHDNTVDNSGYVRFLSEVADGAEMACPQPGRLLDYGSGDAAVLTALLRGRGRRCDAFDPLFGRALPPAGGPYDAIILCEVIEHCRHAGNACRDIAGLLSDAGVAVVRTQCRPENMTVSRWWYAQDLTHINFFSRRALETAAGLMQRRLEETAISDIFLFR